MKQDDFEKRYQAVWEELSNQLDALEKSRFKRTRGQLSANLPGLYRQVCNHYALARGRRYSPTLEEQLHRLVLRGHQHLYTRRGAWLWQLLAFVAVGFPRSLRRHQSYFWLALALFLFPGVLIGGFCMLDESLIYSVMSEAEVANMAEMYRPDNARPGRTIERSAESDFAMFGFYIFNNIGIGFRTFAMGILAGVGTVFTLIYNGLAIGAVAGYLSSLGYHETFWPFVSGHSSLELTAIVICGAAGLMLGRGMIAPGCYSRADAIRFRAKQALPLVMGAGLMLLGAAFIEAFWSANDLPNQIKYIFAALMWLLMILYFIFAGRGARGAG
ncbi:MAG: stage II sporulation protein M [Amphritea sp.]